MKSIRSSVLFLAVILCIGQSSAVPVKAVLAKCDFRGGLAVISGAEDAALAVELGTSSNTLVHVLVREEKLLDKIREDIRKAGVYGRVSADFNADRFLPYADSMVNLLVLEEGVTLDEDDVKRVLAPLGTALRLTSGRAEVQHKKSWPDNVDIWTHSRRDSTGNAVSTDRLSGPPRFTRWEALPRWNHGTKTSAMVTEGGRVFYILSDSHFSTTPSLWYLIARDASNGIELWRHPLEDWEGSTMGKKVGPAQVNRRLVALDGRVYAPLGEKDEICVLHAATGKILRKLQQTPACEEFLVSGDVLVALLNESGDQRFWTRLKRQMKIVAVDAMKGNTLWEVESSQVLPMTLTADRQQVVYHDGTSIRCLDLKSGQPRWTSAPTGQKVQLKDKANCDSPGAEDSTIVLAPQFTPTMVMYNGIVAFAGGRQLNVVSAEDGHELWRAPFAPSNYSTPVDLFGFNDALWGPDINMNLWRPLDDDLGYTAYDPLTGSVKKSVSGKYNYAFQHHRCHQMKVTGNTIIGARAGIEFLDTDTGHLASHHWTRGSCYYGVLPANGLLYVPPHNCACYVRAKLSGLMALSAVEPVRRVPVTDDRRLERGPAYGRLKKGLPAGNDWPTYRRDPGRSGVTSCDIGDDLLLGWQTKLAGSLTAPVVADGRVFVASTDEHRLFALDTAKGSVLWKRTFNGRIDSPPTVCQEVVLCGCRDGSVSALRASDGERVWRFMAAPEERLIVSRGQLESTWPVFGSVLVVNDVAYFAAGKSSYLDDGIRLCGLNVLTGEQVFERILYTRGEDGSELLDEKSVDGYLNDILSYDGQRIYMRHQAFDLKGNPVAGNYPHLHGADGYLSSDTTSRLQWSYAPSYSSPNQGAFYDIRLSRALFPSGRILVEYADTICGFGQNHFEKIDTEPGGSFALFSMPKKIEAPLDLSARDYRKMAMSGKNKVRFHWWKETPVHAWALAGTKSVLFAGGAKGRSFVTQSALDGGEEGLLVAVSPEDGRILAEMYLPAMPVWDGIAIAGDSLFVSMADGSVASLWSAKTGREGIAVSESAMVRMLPPVQVEKEPGLLGRWKLDEGVGNLARDVSGRGHDAAVNGRWSGTGGECSLLTLGRAGALEIPDAGHLHFGKDDFSLSLWLKVDDFDTRLIGKEAFPENWWVINLPPDGRPELVLGEGRGNGKNVRLKTGSPIMKSEWTHLVAVVDRKTAKISWYVNGKPDGGCVMPGSMTGELHGGKSPISIPSSHKPFNGAITDVRIYGCALERERIEKLFRKENERH